VKELERKATELLKESLPQGIHIPIDIEFVLETRAGVDFDYWPKLEANHGVCGAVCRDAHSGILFVFLDEDLADSDHRRNFYRMTVAEELAHVVLHREIIEQVASVEDFCRLQNHTAWYVCERNAKRFAAAVLMPPEELLGESSRIYRKLVPRSGRATVGSDDWKLDTLVTSTVRPLE
jgi:hypothetical protein